MRTETARRLGSVIAGLGAAGALAITGWFAIGPEHIIYALVVQCGFLFMALLVGPAVVDVGRSRYQVRQVEPRIYTLLGADLVRRVLDRVGWNRVIKQMRHSEDAGSGVVRFLRGTEQSETGHLLGAVATVALAMAAIANHPGLQPPTSHSCLAGSYPKGYKAEG